MTKLSDLLAVTKTYLRAEMEYNLGHLPLRTLIEARDLVSDVIRDCEKPYDTSADTHTATWTCGHHRDCRFTVTVGGSEAYAMRWCGSASSPAGADHASTY